MCVCGSVCSCVCEFIVGTVDSVVGVFWATVSSDVVLLVSKDIFCGKALMLLCTWSESGNYKDQRWKSDLRLNTVV